MILIRAEKETCVFQLAAREKTLLFELLKTYSQAPLAQRLVTKSGRLPDQNASQRLLDEALAEQRTENKRRLEGMIKNPHHWKDEHSHWLLTLSQAEIEWLLQVLNDIRVGSWVQLGSPEHWPGTISPETAPRIWSMELAGAFQMAFLHALEGDKEIEL